MGNLNEIIEKRIEASKASPEVKAFIREILEIELRNFELKASDPHLRKTPWRKDYEEALERLLPVQETQTNSTKETEVK